MRSLVRLLPFLTLSCSLVAGFEEFSAGTDGQAGNAGDGAEANLGGGVSENESGGAAGTGRTAGYGGGSGGVSGRAGTAGNATGGSEASGSGASGGLVGAAGAGGEAGAGGSDAGATAGGTAGASSQGGSSAAAGSGGVAGEAPCGELLVNGDFDLGPSAGWREFVTYSESVRIVVPKDDAWLVAQGVPPVAGDYLAWLGGIPDNEERAHTSRLHQTVRIPAKASRLRFSGWLWVKTLEPDSDALYDRSYGQLVQVEDIPDESSVLHVFSQWSNLDSGTGWTEFDFDTTELDALRDRTVTLEVYSRTDLTFETSFWLDSLSLYAECSR
jgi:hypothetical protein